MIVSGELENGTFVAERDSLVTKCPSKFTKDESASDVAGVGSACLAVALLTALYASSLGLRSPESAPRVDHVGPPRDLLRGRPVRGRLWTARVGVPALGLLVRAGGRGLLDGHADLLQGHRAWATQDGSLLLWATLLSLFASAVLFLTRRSLRDIAPYATAVLGFIAAFFCC